MVIRTFTTCKQFHAHRDNPSIGNSQFLQAPPEPMALRLTSNLMVGCARVLNAQYGFYMNDVNHVYMRLKRALLDWQSGNVNMTAPEAR